MTRNGKIARLPKDLRELVNRMMDDGAQHRSIINELEKQRHRWPDKMTDINEDNVGNWKAGGYLDWIREQEIQSDLQARNEYALVVADQFPEQKVNDVALQIGVNHFYHVLAGLDREVLQAKLREDPATWCKVVNTLARVSRAAFDFQKYKDHVREQKERVQAEIDKAKGTGVIREATLDEIERRLKLM